MQLSPIYLQRLEEATQQGIERGAERERQQNVETLLVAKFGEIDAELARVIPSLKALPFAEVASLVLQLSREELLARFEIAR